METIFWDGGSRKYKAFCGWQWMKWVMVKEFEFSKAYE